jgi:hypothetical protein
MNRELMTKVRDQIQNFPDLHDQDSFFAYNSNIRAFAHVPVTQMREGSCLSTACAAGYTVLFSAPPETMTSADCLYLPDGSEDSVEHYAQEQLDISYDNAQWLFFTAINRDMVLWGMNELLEHEDADLTDLYRGEYDDEYEDYSE